MMENTDEKTTNTKKNFDKKKFENYKICKRDVSTLKLRENEIFACNSSKLKWMVAKGQKLFQKGYSEIIIHGIGFSAKTAVNLALILQEKLSHTVDLEVNTSTLELIEDYRPTNDYDLPVSNSKCSSVVHVRVYRKPNF